MGTCPSCDGVGRVDWTTPPYRDDPRYRYDCGTCGGSGKVPEKTESAPCAS